MICNLHEVQNEIHKFLKMDRREKEKKKKNVHSIKMEMMLISRTYIKK